MESVANPLKPSVAFHIKAIHSNQMTSFYMKCSTGCKWFKSSNSKSNDQWINRFFIVLFENYELTEGIIASARYNIIVLIQSNLCMTITLGTTQKWSSWVCGCLVKHLHKTTEVNVL